MSLKKDFEEMVSLVHGFPNIGAGPQSGSREILFRSAKKIISLFPNSKQKIFVKVNMF